MSTESQGKYNVILKTNIMKIKQSEQKIFFKIKKIFSFLSFLFLIYSGANSQSKELIKIKTDKGCIVFTYNPDIISATWTGNCKDSLANGEGVLQLFDKNGLDVKYNGIIFKGTPNGRGTSDLSNGNKYVGDWKEGKKDGQGTMTYSNGGKYVGGWKDDNLNGQGIYNFPDGDKYVGVFKDGNKEGQGTYTWKGGEKYIGGWKDDQRNGQGTMTYSNSQKYVGEWKGGMKNGQGTYTFPNGSKYTGGFLDDNYHGQGTFTKSDGSKYAGEWKEDKKEGQGTMTFPAGSKYKIYEGGWKDDNLYGGGTLTMSDGTKIQLRDGNPLVDAAKTRSEGNQSGNYSYSKRCDYCSKSFSGDHYTHMGKLADCYSTSKSNTINTFCSMKCCSDSRSRR